MPVIVLGETGTGKELVARAVHEGGARAGGPFVAENCGAFAEGVIESELFGHERGAFTGAAARRRGDVRVIAATHRDLPRMVRDGAFRGDLYYRLWGATLEVPALCDRPGDLEALVAFFLGASVKPLLAPTRRARWRTSSPRPRRARSPWRWPTRAGISRRRRGPSGWIGTR